MIIIFIKIENMIHITHLKAHLPFQECSIKFMLKPLQSANKKNQPSIIPLLKTYVDLDLNVSLGIREEMLTQCQELMLCVLAFTDQEKVYVGHVEFNPKASFHNNQQIIKGLEQQEGYLQYSVFHDEMEKQCVISEERDDSKRSPFEEQMSKKSGDEIQNYALHEQQSQNILEKLKIFILQQQLKNQQYRNKLNENQIFQLKIRDKIQGLLGPINELQ